MNGNSAPHPVRPVQRDESPGWQLVLEQALAALQSLQGMDLSPRQQREHRALAGRVFLCRLYLHATQCRQTAEGLVTMDLSIQTRDTKMPEAQ